MTSTSTELLNQNSIGTLKITERGTSHGIDYKTALCLLANR